MAETGGRRPIDAHGVIGDLETAALVDDSGSVRYMCWPRLESATIFADLLSPGIGGSWTIAPNFTATGRQLYLPDTNVLTTKWLSPEGAAEVIDFMPFREGDDPPKFIRRVRALRDRMEFHMRCAPRLDYARTKTSAHVDEHSITFGADGFDALRLYARCPLQLDGNDAVAEFTLDAGECMDFVLLDAKAEIPDRATIDRALDACIDGWRAWVARTSYKGRWREVVVRSALVLKLLTSKRHGSIAAAATFGLPEIRGGSRNWDYRATWIRDASFSVYAYMRLGFTTEANAFMRFIRKQTDNGAPDGSMPVVYALDGANLASEIELDFAGYDASKPVRIGNDAKEQLQLDIYGALLDAIYLANKYGGAIGFDSWRKVTRTVDYVCEHWREPDAGIWETRGPLQHHLHSRVMCWVALDRAIRLATKRSLPAPLERWAAERDRIYASVWDEFWNDDLGRFVRSTEDTALDASMLMMPLVRFVSATDARWLKTLDAIGNELVEDALVFRYRDKGEAAGREGAFTACSFWYAECLARAGRTADARVVFETMLGYGTNLCLFSEELGPYGEQLGNTPQALTHLALISAAFFLDRELSGSDNGLWRP